MTTQSPSQTITMDRCHCCGGVLPVNLELMVEGVPVEVRDLKRANIYEALVPRTAVGKHCAIRVINTSGQLALAVIPAYEGGWLTGGGAVPFYKSWHSGLIIPMRVRDPRLEHRLKPGQAVDFGQWPGRSWPDGSFFGGPDLVVGDYPRGFGTYDNGEDDLKGVFMVTVDLVPGTRLDIDAGSLTPAEHEIVNASRPHMLSVFYRVVDRPRPFIP